ncbi:unnamed protein product, partial [Strongylus vulgaris]
KLKTLEESEGFILEHPHLASEYTANYLTIDALNMAIDNKEEEMSNIARQCIEKRIAAAPGHLDPQEVYESLPEEMRAAFDSQDVSRLQEVALSMDREVFSYHFQRCIDSGLWVPNASAEEGEQTAEAGEVRSRLLLSMNLLTLNS